MRYAAFLGGINVGRRRVAMSKLVDVFEELGHKEVTTFLASGNLVFDSNRRNTSLIERSASSALYSSLAFKVDVFVRCFDDIVEIANQDFFKDEESNGAAINVGFMQQPLASVATHSLEALRTSDDWFRVIGSEFYWICRTQISRSKVWDLPAAKKLDLPNCTIRNIKTVRRIVDKSVQPGA